MFDGDQAVRNVEGDDDDKEGMMATTTHIMRRCRC